MDEHGQPWMVILDNESGGATIYNPERKAQADQIAALREQVARLERVLSRNSGNSSMPPSGDDAAGRTPPRKQRRAVEREARGRSRGKQPGALGR